MAAFLTPEWVERLNLALGDLTLPESDPDAGLVARNGTFTVVEEIRGAPGGDTWLVLRADHGVVRLELVERGPSPFGEEERADVTLVLGYDDATALAQGSLTPAGALTEGRVKVRGDLGVLVAAQKILAAAYEAVAHGATPQDGAR